MSNALRVHDAITKVGYIVSALFLVVIVITYWFEVVARYFFSAPTLWGTSIIAYSLCAVVCLATPELVRINGHVAITILQEKLPARGRRILGRVVSILSTVVAVQVAYIAWLTLISQATSDIRTAAWIAVPRYWLTALIFYALAGSALHFIRHAVSGQEETGKDGSWGGA